MDVDAQPFPRGRKRAASSPPPASDDAVPGAEYDNGENNAAHTATRARVTSELDTLGVIPRDEAWQLNLRDLLEGQSADERNGLVLLSVMGAMEVQLQLVR